uniref:Uncharacterized protein n=1 Tax=Trypanosoma vivax (strain Y486) TaxID=1055687 RepID=G0U3V9_TRYVY|nr:conserved hypothetical protein [Trypanosoma vivax Y486]
MITPFFPTHVYCCLQEGKSGRVSLKMLFRLRNSTIIFSNCAASGWSRCIHQPPLYSSRLEPKTESFPAPATSSPASPPPLHSSLPVKSRSNLYNTRGYDFIEGFQILGPAAALGRLRAAVSIYFLTAAVVSSCTVYWFTTRTYKLTLDPDPKSYLRCKTYSSDYLVLRNRLTGKKHVIDMNVDARSSTTALALSTSAADDVTINKVQSPFSERIVRVNRLLYSVQPYLQVTNSTVVVDLLSQLAPDRFEIKHRHTHAGPSFLSLHETYKTSGESTADSAAGGSMPNCLFFRSQLRPAVERNHSQKGTLPLYERTLESEVKQLIAERYKRAILSQANPCIQPSIAEELLRNGRLNGEGVVWNDVVGDLAEFEEVVRDRLRQRLGDRVVLLNFSITPLLLPSLDNNGRE